MPFKRGPRQLERLRKQPAYNQAADTSITAAPYVIHGGPLILRRRHTRQQMLVSASPSVTAATTVAASVGDFFLAVIDGGLPRLFGDSSLPRSLE